MAIKGKGLPYLQSSNCISLPQKPLHFFSKQLQYIGLKHQVMERHQGLICYCIISRSLLYSYIPLPLPANSISAGFIKDRVSYSVMSKPLRPHGLQPSRLLCPWNSPSKNTGVGSLSLLQGIFPTQGSNPDLLHYRQVLYHLSHVQENFKVHLQRHLKQTQSHSSEYLLTPYRS